MGYAVAKPLYREHELAFRTQYAELKERTLGTEELLPGTPGSLALRAGSGRAYWYRVFYTLPRKVREELVCKEGNEKALNAMRERMDFAGWAAAQVTSLRKLEFQTADKATARVLVELHNRQAFEAGLILVGTLGYMAWLNELGAIAVTARTLDIDLARRQKLKLAAPLAFLDTMKSTGRPFVAVPGLPSTAPSTSVKLPGVEGLRVNVLAPGKALGAAIKVPELEWMAQAIPHYDYLLADAERGAMLAGGALHPGAPAASGTLRLAQVVRQHAAPWLSGKGCEGPAAGSGAGGGARRERQQRTQGCLRGGAEANAGPYQAAAEPASRQGSGSSGTGGRAAPMPGWLGDLVPAWAPDIQRSGRQNDAIASNVLSRCSHCR